MSDETRIIERIEARVYRVPEARPVATSFDVMRDRPAVFVKVTAVSGAFGCGDVFAKWGGVSGNLPVARAIVAAGLTYCPRFLGGGIGLLASAHLLAAKGFWKSTRTRTRCARLSRARESSRTGVFTSPARPASASTPGPRGSAATSPSICRWPAMADPVGLNAGLLALVLATYLVAGTIKGVTGLGFPAICIGLTTLFLTPRTAIALVLFPMIVSNFWQIWRAGQILRPAREYAVFAVITMIGAFAVAFFAAGASDRLLHAVTGIAFVLFVLVNLTLDLPPLPDRFDRAAQLGFGASAGILGGLTAIWAPPIAIYLSARHRTGDEFVRASGLLISLGSPPHRGLRRERHALGRPRDRFGGAGRACASGVPCGRDHTRIPVPGPLPAGLS